MVVWIVILALLPENEIQLLLLLYVNGVIENNPKKLR
jgi:hypothetical protein